MMLFLIFLLTVISGNGCYAQISGPEWKLETGLPAENIFSVRVIDNRVYAGATGRVFVSEPGKSSWQTIAIPATNVDIEDIARYGGKLYLAAYRHGVLESNDAGNTWQTMPGSAGTFPVEFAESEGRLCVAGGNAVGAGSKALAAV